MTLKDMEKVVKGLIRNSAWSQEEESDEKEWTGMKLESSGISSFKTPPFRPFYLFQPPLPMPSMPSAKVLQVTFSSKPVMDSQDLHVRHVRFRFTSSSDKEIQGMCFKNFQNKWRIEGKEWRNRKECENANDSKHEWKWIIQDDHTSNCHELPAPLGDGGSVSSGKLGLAKMPKIHWKSSEVKLSRNVEKRKRYLAHLETFENTKTWGTLGKEKSLAWINLWLAHSWLSEQKSLLFPHGLALLAWVSLQVLRKVRSNHEHSMDAHIYSPYKVSHGAMGHDHLLHNGLNLTAHLPAWFCASRSIPQFWFRAAKYRGQVCLWALQ